jgi:hypothetical protein
MFWIFMTTATGKKIKTDKGYIQYFNPDEIELARGLPDDMIAAFEATGNAQRSDKGCPETVMRNSQRFHGGVMTYMMEHIGDITHRLTHQIRYGDVLTDYVREKVDKGMRTLSRGQGFIDESRENMVNNAEHANMSFDEFSAEFDKFLDAYVKGHENVPVYNRIQWMGREAAIQLGKLNFEASLSALRVLEKELENPHTFVLRATMVHRDHAGGIIQFEDEDLYLNLNRNVEEEVELAKVS